MKLSDIVALVLIFGLCWFIIVALVSNVVHNFSRHKRLFPQFPFKVNVSDSGWTEIKLSNAILTVDLDRDVKSNGLYDFEIANLYSLYYLPEADILIIYKEFYEVLSYLKKHFKVRDNKNVEKELKSDYNKISNFAVLKRNSE